jgi:hypothetical protein
MTRRSGRESSDPDSELGKSESDRIRPGDRLGILQPPLSHRAVTSDRRVTERPGGPPARQARQVRRHGLF